MKKNLFRSKKGQGAVEFALSSVLFFAFLFIFADMVRICNVWVRLQYAVNEAARIGSVGGDSTSVTDKVREIAGNLKLDGESVEVTFSSVSGNAGNGPGQSSSLYTLEAQSPVVLNPFSGILLNVLTRPYFNTTHTLNVTAETVIRNEAFT